MSSVRASLSSLPPLADVSDCRLGHPFRQSGPDSVLSSRNRDWWQVVVSRPQISRNEAKFPKHFKDRLSIGNVGVRSSVRQPRSTAFGYASLSARKRPPTAAEHRRGFSLRAPISRFQSAKLPKVSGPIREYSRFQETAAGDLVRSRLSAAVPRPVGLRRLRR